MPSSTLYSFLQILVPGNNDYLRCKMTQCKPYRLEAGHTLPHPVERELASLIFEGEILMFRRCEERRRDLANRHDFSTYACYRAIDELNEGAITFSNVREFLKRAGHYPSEDEVAAIVRRLDDNGDNLIYYTEFSESIKP